LPPILLQFLSLIRMIIIRRHVFYKDGVWSK
jgi:hypothetical protein